MNPTANELSRVISTFTPSQRLHVVTVCNFAVASDWSLSDSYSLFREDAPTDPILKAFFESLELDRSLWPTAASSAEDQLDQWIASRPTPPTVEILQSVIDVLGPGDRYDLIFNLVQTECLGSVEGQEFDLDPTFSDTGEWSGYQIWTARDDSTTTIDKAETRMLIQMLRGAR